VRARGANFGLAFPHILGSDPAGEVVAVGEGGDSGLVGERVVVHHLLHCGQCTACRTGQIQRCRQYGVFGVQCPGGDAEYTVAPVRNLLPIPTGLSDAEASAMMVMYPTAWHLLVTRGGLQPC